MELGTPISSLTGKDNSELVNNILSDMDTNDERGGEQGGVEEYEDNAPKFVPPPRRSNNYEWIMEEAKEPIIVGLIVFALSMDVVNKMITQNISRVVSDGKMNYMGFLLKAVVGAAAYYFIKRFLLV